MRRVTHGVVYFPNSADEARIVELMVDYCSARRSAYQALQRGLSINEARNSVKQRYRHLGQRAVNDAVLEAGKIKHPKAIFGGKLNWEKFQAGKISKEEWLSKRNDAIYSRGDKSKSGNPNLRIVNNELWISDLGRRGKWLKGKLWLNEFVDLDCYGVRVQRKGSQFTVTVSWEDGVVVPVVTTKALENGVIGLDVNPAGIALVETDSSGNLLHHQWLQTGRIQYASKNKRKYDIKELAITVVEKAISTRKAIVLEKLKFYTKNTHGWRKKSSKKFNRMASNFLWSQMINSIKIRAAKSGVEIIEVNPAFTSKVGLLKYRDMYSLSDHAAAALVTARLGMGLKEVVRVNRVESNAKGKKRVNLEGRTRRIALTPKAFSWMQALYTVRPKPPGVTPPRLDSDKTNRFFGHTSLVSSSGEKVIPPITGQAGLNTRQEDERLPVNRR